MDTPANTSGTRGFLAHEATLDGTEPPPVTPNAVTDKHHAQVEHNESGIVPTPDRT